MNDGTDGDGLSWVKAGCLQPSLETRDGEGCVFLASAAHDAIQLGRVLSLSVKMSRIRS